MFKKIKFSSIISTNVILLIFIVSGALIRLYNLGEASFWGDEILSIEASGRINSIQTFFSPDPENAHPPLYFLMLKLWLSFGNSELYARLLSVIFGILSIPIAFIMTKIIFDKRVAIICAFFVSFSPFLIRFDREVRMYPLFLLLTLLTLYFFLIALESNSKKRWLLFSLFGVLNLYTHYHSIIVLFCCFVYGVMTIRHKKYKYFIISYLLMVIFYSFWIDGFFYHFFSFSALGSEVPTRFPSTYGFWIKPIYLIFSFTFGQAILPWDWKITIPAALVFGYAFIYVFPKIIKNKKISLFFMCFFLLPIILGLVITELMPRYMIFIYPFYITLASYCICRTKPAFKKVILTVIVTIYSISFYNFYSEKNYHILASTTPWREIGVILNKQYEYGDIILNVGNSPSLKYYLEDHLIISDNAELYQVINNSIELNENLWLIIAIPSFYSQANDLVNQINKNEYYILKDHFKLKKDTNYLDKQKYFNKYFMKYRAEIYHFKKIKKDLINL